MQSLLKIESAYSKVLNFLGVVLALIVPVLMVVQVILRYVLKMPLMGIEELLQFPTVWLYMIGGALASLTRTHIECGVLSVYVKNPKTMASIRVLKNIFTVIIASWLGYWCFWYANYSFGKWKLTPLLQIPQFLGDVSLLIGVVLMAVYAVIDLVIAVRNLKNPPPVVPE